MARRRSEKVTKESQANLRERKIREFTSECEWTPEPSYRFGVGDQVEIGSLRDVVISEVFENGKFYEIDCTTFDTNYGNPIITPHVKMLWWWFDLRPISTSQESLIENDDLRLYYSQRHVESLLHLLYHFRLNMNPSYQRGYVWTAEDKVLLIDSIMKNIDIGKFVVVKLPYSESFLYEILDGKQRLSALAEFYENRFAYHGLHYNDLSRHDKHHFKNYPIAHAELDNISEQQKLRYFLTLNRTGKVMNREHLAKIERLIEK